VSPEEPLVDETVAAGISRRRMLKRVGAGAAIAWTAPVLSSIRTPAFGVTGGGCVSESCGCDLNTPCNFAIDCHSSGGTCNCWVQADRSACHCGPFDACSNHQSCVTNTDCPSTQCCIENCCGRLCYAPCSVAAGSGPPAGANPANYGVTRF
jgi:hypothetical protein